MAEYIEEAKRFYREATKEFERGKKEGDATVIRNAAEKAWGAVVQATNEFIAKQGRPAPKTHRERRDILYEIERSDPKAKALGLRDRFMAREYGLHAECFYDGVCPLVVLEEDITEKVKSYIEDVEKL